MPLDVFNDLPCDLRVEDLHGPGRSLATALLDEVAGHVKVGRDLDGDGEHRAPGEWCCIRTRRGMRAVGAPMPAGQVTVGHGADGTLSYWPTDTYSHCGAFAIAEGNDAA